MDAPLCRSASPDDVPQILTYVRELAAWEGRPDAATASAHDLRELLFGSHPLAEAVMLLDPAAGTPVGYAWFYLTTATFTGRAILYLEDLYVTPAARGLGLNPKNEPAGASLVRSWPRSSPCTDELFSQGSHLNSLKPLALPNRVGIPRLSVATSRLRVVQFEHKQAILKALTM